MRIVIFMLALMLTGASCWAGDRETNAYWAIFEELKTFEPDAQALEKKMVRKVTAADCEAAVAKYKELRLSWDKDRKKLAELKHTSHPDIRDLVKTMIDQQDAWVNGAATVIETENRANDYFKGKSNGYDPDRGQAMAATYRERAKEAHKAYDEAKTKLAAALKL